MTVRCARVTGHVASPSLGSAPLVLAPGKVGRIRLKMSRRLRNACSAARDEVVGALRHGDTRASDGGDQIRRLAHESLAVFEELTLLVRWLDRVGWEGSQPFVGYGD